MKRLLSLLPLIFFAVGAAPPQPPAPIVALTQAILDAANANDPAKLANVYADSAIVIDENAPFVWHGASAGVQWWHSVQRVLEERHATLHVPTSPPGEYQTDREGDDAYVEQKLDIAVTSNGKTHIERGTQTYTFHKSDEGEWKISRQVWTTTLSPLDSTAVIPPNAEAPMHAAVDAFNKRQPAILGGIFDDDATFIDDLSPFTWDGANAGTKWYKKADKDLVEQGVSTIHGSIGKAFESRVSGNGAYVIVPVTWLGILNGKPFTQGGSYTFTLQREKDVWLITSQTWLSTN